MDDTSATGFLDHVANVDILMRPQWTQIAVAHTRTITPLGESACTCLMTGQRLNWASPAPVRPRAEITNGLSDTVSVLHRPKV